MRVSGVVVVACLFLLGCSRTYYRQQADVETYDVLQERTGTPGASLPPRPVEAHPTSRLADPYPPDCVPKPPDEVTAAMYMARPGGFRGSKEWAKYGNAAFIDDPNWVNSLGLDSTGTLKLNQDKAVELALLNSREYQSAVEQLYLTALSLTLNRFDFATQWAAGLGAGYVRQGASSLPDESNTVAVAPTGALRRNLASGGQLLVNFANSFVWEFTGGSQTVTSSLGGTLIQPLLRGFGRYVRLENLTQGERDTLYAVRDFARFRKQFWSDVAVQGRGYLNLLLQVQAVRNAKANLRALEENYSQSLDLFRGGRLSDADVDRTFQSLLQARQQILNAEIGLQSSLDQYKLQLGLPPRVPLELDDSYLQPFVVTSPELEKVQGSLLTFDQNRKKEFANLPDAEQLRSAFAELAKLTKDGLATVPGVQADVKAWKGFTEQPLQADDDPDALDRSKEAFKVQADLLAKSMEGLKILEDRIALHVGKLNGATRPESWKNLIDDTRALVTWIDDLATAQNLARIYKIRLDIVQMKEADAIAEAKANRLDLQNAQARVTDAWRKVIVAANLLQSDLTVTGSYNLNTEPGSKNPFNFSNDASRLAIGVQFDGPLNRQFERNAYRAAQISYQVSRRAYMQLNDIIELQIRDNLRNLRLARVSFEINRQSLLSNARQLASERALLNAPVQPRNAANRDATLSTLQALANLNAARNSLAGFYIAYEQQRISLLLNLEALQLDARGYPINAANRVNNGTNSGPAVAVPATPPVPVP